MRISDQTIVNRLLVQVTRAQRDLSEMQQRVGSGKRISRPADDPYGASQVMASRTELERLDQYDRNASVALSDLGATEAALDRVNSAVARAVELATQGANGSLSGAGRSAIALEVSQLLTEVMAAGNSTHAGRYLFAGQKIDTVPFVPDNPNAPTIVTYNGDTGLIQREVSQGARVDVNITGDRVFPQVMATMIQLRDDLNANNVPAIDIDLTALQSQQDDVLELRSEIGAKTQRTQMAQTQLSEDRARVQSFTSGVEDADIAQSIVQLQSRETAYQAALGAASRTLGLSILDFLK